jgi:8-oxoguanine DNA glycosylase
MIKVQSSYMDMEKIANSGQIFRMYKITEKRFELIAGQHLLDIETLGEGCYAFNCDQMEYDLFWRDYFDMDTDYSAFAKDIAGDDYFLQEAERYARGIRILHQDPFEMLITFIISQRKSIPAIRTSVEKLCMYLGREIENGKYAFPTPEAIAFADEGKLSNCSLGYRQEYIQKTAQMVVNGEIDLQSIGELSDRELVEELKRCSGVGTKVANCVALFGYHRIDAFPVDVWIQKVIDRYYNGKFPIERYCGYAGVIQQYMFYYGRAVEKNKKSC